MSECEDMTEGQNGATAFTGCTGKQAWTRLTFTRKHLKDEELPMSWANCVLCVMFCQQLLYMADMLVCSSRTVTGGVNNTEHGWFD